MIKVSLRPNLIYPIYLIIWTFLRKIVSILISKIFKFKGSVLYTHLMFFGEMIGGFIFYNYQKGIGNKHQTELSRESILITRLRKTKMQRADGILKISFLIFVTSFFDFLEFILSTYYISKIKNKSGTLQIRLGGILIIISSLVCWFFSKFSIFRHQILSLTIIGISLIILIISEFLFQKYDIIISPKYLFFAIFLSILSHLSIALNNTIEKYLIDFNFLHPFLVLTIQGIIGFCFTFICAIYENPIPDIKLIYTNNSSGMFTLFIFLLLFYTVFGGLKNIYRMDTIMLFSPMNKHLADIFINPLYIIYYFSVGEDFSNNGGRNYFYFFLNLIILIIFDICGLIYNEFLIISCYGMGYNTYKSITLRASQLEELDSIYDDDKIDSEYYIND